MLKYINVSILKHILDIQIHVYVYMYVSNKYNSTHFMLYFFRALVFDIDV